MENQRTWHEEIGQKLTSLRAALSERQDLNAHRLFDEFVREHEWGLALHVVCDFLLEPTTPAASAALIQQIEALHKAMSIEDTCVADLREKAKQRVGG